MTRSASTSSAAPTTTVSRRWVMARLTDRMTCSGLACSAASPTTTPAPSSRATDGSQVVDRARAVRPSTAPGPVRRATSVVAVPKSTPTCSMGCASTGAPTGVRDTLATAPSAWRPGRAPLTDWSDRRDLRLREEYILVGGLPAIARADDQYDRPGGNGYRRSGYAGPRRTASAPPPGRWAPGRNRPPGPGSARPRPAPSAPAAASSSTSIATSASARAASTRSCRSWPRGL